VQAAASFARAGVSTTLLHAKRVNTLALPAGVDLFAHYEVPAGARPAIEAVPCTDWIDRVPRALQYWPARLQELSFSRNAAQRVASAHSSAVVLSREIECALRLVRGGHKAVFVEIHRVPEGATRKRWLREVGERCAGAVAISHGVLDDLVEFGIARNKLIVAHDAFEVARFAALPSRERARQSLQLDPEARVVVYTGGLLEWKGVDVLVDAMRELPDAQLVVAGGMAADVERVRRRARGARNVRIDGLQPPARVAEYLVAADVAVVPNRSQPAISSRYTSPLKVFEAMAIGVPLVASDLPSLRELLKHDVDAWLVSPDDARALAAGIRRVLDDDALRTRLAKQLHERAPEHTWDARARQLLGWFHLLLRHAG
jgi:glycosyltransferase involved in cell wall biosynthesis